MFPRLPLPLASALALLASVLPAQAQSFPRQDLPPELRPWVAWVLDEAPDLACPQVQGHPVCLWPGRLRLDLGEKGGTFALTLRADRALEVPLPGSDDHWPEDVRLDGRPAPVYRRDRTPRLRVEPGTHRVAGTFSWSTLPESLAVPAAIGLVDLGLDARPVPKPRREAGGLLWLRARAAKAAAEGDSLRLQVFRKVTDGVPLFVETRVQLEVAGRPREVAFPAALLPGSEVASVRGDLPARVEDGTLRVQVRGGRFAVTVLARIRGNPTRLERPAARPPKGLAVWPAREVWVFAADERLRQVDLSGPPAVDPSRTELPPGWRTLPAFLVDPGAHLDLATVRRGQPEPAPDALTLAREVWIDPDGRGATVKDRFGGVLHSTTRLNLLPPGTLGRVAVDGRDQLVTADPAGGAAGVELRRPALHLEADSRLPLSGPLAAVGWQTGVDQLRATLHLPPGWSLLWARGVDEVPGTWVARWTLLGFFFVLLVSFGAYRLFGAGAAALALVALVLSHGEPGAPALVWLSLVGAIALRRAAPGGRLGSLARIWFLASAGILLLALVPFARDQVRDALFPQVEEAGVGALASKGRPLSRRIVSGRATGGVASVAPVPTTLPAAAPEEEVAKLRQGMTLRDEARARGLPERKKVEAPAPSSYAYNMALEQDPKAVLQTGPGVPAWTWRRYQLSWSGPVSRDQTMRLVLASPGLNRLLTLLRLGLLGSLGFVLLAGRWPRWPRRPRPESTIAALLGVLSLIAVSEARAQAGQTPDPKLLQELKTRLTRPAPCAPHCVATARLRLRLAAGRLTVAAEVHAGADGSWAVPGPLGSWAPADLRLDGARTAAAAALPDNFLHVRLSPGVHSLEASGPAPSGDSFAIQFADPPRRASVDAPGWEVSGLRADGPAEPSILFTRRIAAPAGASGGQAGYAPWLTVTRTLRFGIAWTVETRVHRLTPRGTPIAVRIPLLAGEAPTRADLVVEKGEAAVSLGRDDQETRWSSTLEQAPRLDLRAAEGRPFSEVWRLECSVLWSCSATGLPPVERASGGVFAPEYRPWPGEGLEVRLAHPSGVAGATLTLDGVAIASTPGARSERVDLSVRARGSREQPLVLGLPEEARVQQVRLDGKERPSRPKAGELRITVPAGAHTIEVRWLQERGIGLRHALPRVRLPGSAVNVSEQLRLPPNRWLLLTRGPAWGPAVLFWPYVALLLAVALLLGRVPLSPLSGSAWLLLGLGLSQTSAVGALIVVGFVFALAARQRRPAGQPWLFDLVQAGILVWAVVALALVYGAIHTGLLFRPDMQVAGNGSTNGVLRWYADRVEGATPAARVWSVPLWLYRAVMLAWALWLAMALVRAAGWAWRAFGEGGYWRPLRLPRRPPPAAPGPEVESPPV